RETMNDRERETEEKSKRTLREWFTSSQALLSMLLVQVFVTGMQLLSRIILVQGTFIFSLIAYRHIVAAICVAPFALYFERQRSYDEFYSHSLVLALRQRIDGDDSGSRAVLLWSARHFGYLLCELSELSSYMHILYLYPMQVMEQLGLHSWAGRAKCGGAILCVGGALASSIYKGKEFYLGHHKHHAQNAVVAHQTHMLRGTFFLICSCFSYTAWFLVQVRLLKVFPLRYWGTMIACVLATIQGGIIGVCIDSSKAAWRLQWNLQLVTIVYSGALSTAASFCILSWAISVKGPTYPPMFNPLALIFVAFSEAIILGEPLSIGTFLGMVLIMVGLYSFLWGKNIETTTTVVPSSSSMNTVVLEVEKSDKN
ncbi:WAT1-related protein, partial [Mucuna pruriens]